MTLAVKLSFFALLAVGLLTAPAGAEETAALKTQKDRVSYGIGVDLGKNFKQHRIEVDVDILVKGLKDGLAGQKLLIPEYELRGLMNEFIAEQQLRQRQAMYLAGRENKKEGDAFLEKNKSKEGVVTLPSGLQYRILKAGDGRKPTDADTVECHYRGTLIDGTEFESSYRTGKPAIFQVAGVIRGWKEALKLMPAGSQWQLYIPPTLAYGERGTGSDVPPNATLIFELELLSVK